MNNFDENYVFAMYSVRFTDVYIILFDNSLTYLVKGYTLQ